MNNCPTQLQLELLHDGELESANGTRAEIRGHLASCDECSRYLNQLSVLSGQISAGFRPVLLPMQLQRLHAQLDQTIDRGLVRTSWILSAIAASVLVVGSVWLHQLNDQPEVAPPWVGVTATNDSVVHDADTPVAQWYLADAMNTRSDADWSNR